MKITCSRCGHQYTFTDTRVQGRRFRFACRTCGLEIFLDGRALGPPLPQPTPAAETVSVRDRAAAPTGGGADPAVSTERVPPEDDAMTPILETASSAAPGPRDDDELPTPILEVEHQSGTAREDEEAATQVFRSAELAEAAKASPMPSLISAPPESDSDLTHVLPANLSAELRRQSETDARRPLPIPPRGRIADPETSLEQDGPSWVVEMAGQNETMSTAEIRELLGRGIIDRETRVRAIGSKKWRSLASTRALSEALGDRAGERSAGDDAMTLNDDGSASSRELDARELWEAAGIANPKKRRRRSGAITAPKPALAASRVTPKKRQERSSGRGWVFWLVVACLLVAVLMLGYVWGGGGLR